MITHVTITVIVDDATGKAGLIAEHGLSLWIESDDKRILFDTGQSAALVQNARILGIDLGCADAIVLSHGHYDHTGGLAAVLDINNSASIFIHPEAVNDKYARSDSPPYRYIGIPPGIRKTLQKMENRVIWTRDTTMVCDGVQVTGAIPRSINPIHDKNKFFRDSICSTPDNLIDDQALFIETAAGTVAILGCAHAGVTNTLNYIASINRNQRIHAIIGGMHLEKASKNDMELITWAIRSYSIDLIAPCHCTGRDATAALREAFPEQYREIGVGTVMDVLR